METKDKPKVALLESTKSPLSMISTAAGNSYGKIEPSVKRVERCLKQGHMSVFEHASATFRIWNISRACSHQLVRHRLASFVQKSQRYTKVAVWDDGWYVTPPDILGNEEELPEFDRAMSVAADQYCKLLDEGFKPEDARYALPEATKTELVMTMNVRELFHFWDLRMATDAQWEIRELANAIFDNLFDEGDYEWRLLLKMYKQNQEGIL